MGEIKTIAYLILDNKTQECVLWEDLPLKERVKYASLLKDRAMARLGYHRVLDPEEEKDIIKDEELERRGFYQLKKVSS